MLITNAMLFTWGLPRSVLTDHALHISGDRIREIGPDARLEELHT